MISIFYFMHKSIIFLAHVILNIFPVCISLLAKMHLPYSLILAKEWVHAIIVFLDFYICFCQWFNLNLIKYFLNKWKLGNVYVFFSQFQKSINKWKKTKTIKTTKY